MEIKPIETTYNGYRFRSRLEARWAVFFDTLGIRYEYEPEGFEMSNGIKYLPDFCLYGIFFLSGPIYTGTYDFYFEVKPPKEIPIPELRKINSFASTGQRIIVAQGSPDLHTSLYLFASGAYPYHPESFGRILFMVDIDKIGIINVEYLLRDKEAIDAEYIRNTVFRAAKLQNAYKKARQARFEKVAQTVPVA